MHTMSIIAWLYWNPHRDLFTIPYFDHPVTKYGVCFVLGLLSAYWILIYLFKQNYHELSSKTEMPPSEWAHFITDRMTWFVVGGTIIGARLGHVFFYGWPYFQHHPGEILQVWKGGLASHGGVAGILIGLFLCQRTLQKNFPKLTFLRLLDLLSIPAVLTGCWIRIGNFFNQEILGTESSLPWAVVFGQPADSSSIIPRHPAQLYEALAYLIIFGILFLTWKFKGTKLRSGVVSGLCLFLVFTVRFALEFLKTHQSMVIDESFFQMGQLLSVPFILGGLGLIAAGIRKPEAAK